MILATPFSPVSWGELIDKITILEIKSERLDDETALTNVRKELELLSQLATEALELSTELETQKRNLHEVNQALWVIEDRIREKEAGKCFDGEFIHLARSVYKTNDMRAAIKRRINELLASELVEEKSYKRY
jgi:hypothetical protein